MSPSIVCLSTPCVENVKFHKHTSYNNFHVISMIYFIQSFDVVSMIYFIQSFVDDPQFSLSVANISSRFCSNSEAFASELLQNLE